MLRARRGSGGFTLIELMVVIAILAILFAILTPVLMRARFKTYHSACIGNVRNLATGLESYAMENDGRYPETLAILSDPSTSHMRSLPACPSVNEEYEGTYEVSGNGKEYRITCPGIHSLQLPGVVEEGAPGVSNGAMYLNEAPPELE